MRRTFVFWLLLAVVAFPFSAKTVFGQKERAEDKAHGIEEGHQQEMIDWYHRFLNPTNEPNMDALRMDAFAQWQKMSNIPTIASSSSSAWQQLGTSLNNGTNSGRATSIAIDPTDPNKMFLATSMGGLWKSLDAGKNWVSVSDNWATLAMGAVGIDPKNPNVIYAATGDNWGNSGVGVYKSVDDGTNWSLVSSNAGSHGYQIIVSPDSSELVYLTSDRGVQVSSNGGVNWRVTNTSGSVAYIVLDPSNSSNLYAAGGGTISKSIDRGRTWTSVYTVSGGASLMTLGISPNDPLKIYCSISNSNSTASIVRSVDGGNTWTLMTSNQQYLNSGGNPQGWYANALAVNPNNADDIVVGGLDIYRSLNGGKTLLQKTEWRARSSNSNFTHADVHHLVYHTSGGATTLYTLTDGGVYYSKTNGESWSQDMNKTLSTFQFVGGDVSPDFTFAYAGAQDNGVNRIPIGQTFWTDIHGGDGGLTTVSQTDGQTVYSEYLGVVLYRSDNAGSTWASGNQGSDDLLAGSGIKSEPVGGYMDYDVSETTPTIIGLVGASHLWLAVDGTNFSSVTGTGSGFSGQIRCVHIAKTDPNYIYAGSSSSVVCYSTDQGQTWSRSKTPMAYVAALTTDVADPTHVFAVMSGYSGPHFAFSTDTGRTWTKPTTNLPNGVYKRIAVAPDGQLFISNDFGVLRSQDGGNTWWPMKEGLAQSQVTSLRVRGTGGQYLVATTYGRGMYYIDLAQLPHVPLTGVAPSGPAVASNGSQPAISGVYPNPVALSNAHGTVNFSLPKEGRMTLSVYDALGREERVIANQWISAGSHTQEMDLTNIISGHHFLVLTANGRTVTQSLTIQ